MKRVWGRLRRWLTVPFRWVGHLLDEPAEVAWLLTILGVMVAVGGYWYLHGFGSFREMVYDFYGNIPLCL